MCLRPVPVLRRNHLRLCAHTVFLLPSTPLPFRRHRKSTHVFSQVLLTASARPDQSADKAEKAKTPVLAENPIRLRTGQLWSITSFYDSIIASEL